MLKEPKKGKHLVACIKAKKVSKSVENTEESLELDKLVGVKIMIVDDIKWNFKVLQQKLLKFKPVRVTWSNTIEEMWKNLRNMD